MNIEKLLSINSKLKRRLLSNFEDSKPVLYDALGKRIDAQFIAADILDVFLLDPERLANKDKPYKTNFEHSEFIGEDEAKIILGYDYFTRADEWDIPTMLKACEGGYGGARTNAYWLGPIHPMEESHVEIPVAYFIIPKKEQQRLIINPNDSRFKETLEALKKTA